MDRGMVIVIGALLTFTSSWLGLVLLPYWQMQEEQPFVKSSADDPYPHLAVARRKGPQGSVRGPWIGSCRHDNRFGQERG